MKTINMHYLLMKIVPILLCFSLATSANAQAQTGSVKLEEIVVTAQKREESLQDVPISIMAISGEKLTDNGVFKIDDLQAFTPNLSMTETGIGTQIFIRGIGTGTNPGFEQSVGTYIDGIYYGRPQLLRMPFLDLQQIEVLRGPQSILFGKNSIAGALNMRTAAPTKEFEGLVSVNYSPDSDLTELTGVISGSLSENVSARLAVRKYDEEGWVENTFKNETDVKRDESAVRLSLLWDATENLKVGFKAEQAKFDATGRLVEIVIDQPAQFGPFAGLNYSQILGAVGHPGGLTESEQNNQRQTDGPELSDNKVENYTLTVDYELDSLTLTAITGLVGYEFDEEYDGDFTGAPIFEGRGREKYDQFSQEFRLASPGGEKVDWIAGAFYQTSEIDFSDAAIFPSNGLLGAINPAAAPVLGTEAARVYKSDSDMWSLFGQATWNIEDNLRLALGGRYTSEKKIGFREVNILDSSTGAITANPLAAIVWTGLGIQNQQFTGHSISDSRDEGVFTPLVNLQWEPSEDSMLYISYSTGFKSGGFDARANSVDFFEFEDEEATTYELGSKSTFLDGALELNAALYRTEYDDLQTSQYDGQLGFTVGNAKKTVVQGIELDGRWALTDSLTMGYGLAYLDHEYKDYTAGNCYNGQVPDGVDGYCDYSGKVGPYAPDITGNLSFTHKANLTSELRLQSSIEVSFKGEQNIHVNLDPNGVVDPTTAMNFRMALQAEKWDIALLVQNLTDEQLLTRMNNAPLSSSFGTNSFYSFATRPRTTYLQLKYRF
jgi:iron complex outermembrane receptor protein